MPVFQCIAVFATTLFTGAAIYITVAEHPARMECGMAIAAMVFRPSYRRAAVMQAGLAVVATAAAIAAWSTGAAASWLVGALLIFSVIPFTFVVMMPTNKNLLDPTLDPTSDTVRGLLQRWGKLHFFRSILALAASLLMLASVEWPSPAP